MKDRVEHISEDTINLLLDAAADVEAYIARGVDPKKAFMDVAKKYDLTPEQTKLLIRGWNITNFTEKLSSSKKLEDRCSDIPVLHFDEFEQFLRNSIKNASRGDNSIWYGYYAPPESRIKRVYQKDPLSRYSRVLEIDESFAKIAAAEKFVNRNFNKIIDLRKQAADAFKSLISEFQLKFASLKDILRTLSTPKDVILGNLRVVNPLAARITMDAFKNIKQARLEGQKSDYSFDANKEPYKTSLKCAELMLEIDKKAVLLSKLEKIWRGYRFDDEVIEKKAKWAVDLMEVSPLVGGVYSKRRFGYFYDNVLDVEDPDFFVFNGSEAESPPGLYKAAENEDNEEDEYGKEDEYDDGIEISPPKFTEEDVLDDSYQSMIPPFGEEFSRDNLNFFTEGSPLVFFARKRNGGNFGHKRRRRWRQKERKPGGAEGGGNKPEPQPQLQPVQPAESQTEQPSEPQSEQPKSQTEEQKTKPGLVPIDQGGGENTETSGGKKRPGNERGPKKENEKSTKEPEKRGTPFIKRVLQAVANKGRGEKKTHGAGEKEKVRRVRENVSGFIAGLGRFLPGGSGQPSSYLAELEESAKNIHNVEKYNEVAKTLHFIKDLSLTVELMSIDPIINDYTLEEVLYAVSTLRSLSPLIAENMLLLRAFTRKILEQGGVLDLNDIATLIRLSSPKSE